jgi:hypothetical protein
MKDFFISYNRNDAAWAEWIAWTLEEAGYSVVFQAWDFRPGGDFVLEIHNAAQGSERTIAVLSRSYLQAEYTQPEWAAAFARDPRGGERKLIPVRVDKCKPGGLLRTRVYVDLVGLSEADARVCLLGAFSDRAKPNEAPPFPVEQATGKSNIHHREYPGEDIALSIVDTLNLTPEASASVAKRDFSTVERLNLIAHINAIPPQQFNMLVFALNPPPGLVPPMPAPQGDRSAALLGWVESAGFGLSPVADILEKIRHPPQALPETTPIPVAGRVEWSVVSPPDGERAPHRPLLLDLERSLANGRLQDSRLGRHIYLELNKERELELAAGYEPDWVITGILLSDEYFVRVRTGAGHTDWQRDFAQTVAPALVGVARALERSADAHAVVLRLCEVLAAELRLRLVWPDDPDRSNELRNAIYRACIAATSLEDDDVLMALSDDDLRVIGPQ